MPRSLFSFSLVFFPFFLFSSCLLFLSFFYPPKNEGKERERGRKEGRERGREGRKKKRGREGGREDERKNNYRGMRIGEKREPLAMAESCGFLPLLHASFPS